MGALAVTLAGGTLLGVSQVFAQTTTPPFESLVEKIADKFHLNKSDVQAVFDQDLQERKAAMEKRFEDRLTQLVKDGKITDAQKKLIEDKRKELDASRKERMAQFKDMTPDERKAQMQKDKQALKDWAKQNGIDQQYLFPRFGEGGMMGPWHHM